MAKRANQIQLVDLTIIVIRGQRMMLDSEPAAIYCLSTRELLEPLEKAKRQIGFHVREDGAVCRARTKSRMADRQSTVS